MKITKYTLSFLMLVLMPLINLSAEITNYSAEILQKSKSANELILLDFSASWCPTCKTQGKILTELASDKEYSEIKFLKVDYDLEKELKKQFNVTQQSTLILLKGDKEINRAIGIKEKIAIVNFLKLTK